MIPVCLASFAWGETRLTKACVKKLHTTAIVKAMDSATADRFRDLLTDNPRAKFKKKVWRTPGDLRAYVAKKKWIRFHIDPANSMRELRPHVYLVTVEVSRHNGKDEADGNDDGVSYEFVIDKNSKKDCVFKDVKIIEIRKTESDSDLETILSLRGDA